MAHIDVSIEEWQYLPQHHVYVRQPTGDQAYLELEVYWSWRIHVIVHPTFHFLVLDFIVQVGNPGSRYGKSRPLHSNHWELKCLLLLQVLEDARSVCYDNRNIYGHPSLVLVVL